MRRGPSLNLHGVRGWGAHAALAQGLARERASERRRRTQPRASHRPEPREASRVRREGRRSNGGRRAPGRAPCRARRPSTPAPKKLGRRARARATRATRRAAPEARGGVSFKSLGKPCESVLGKAGVAPARRRRATPLRARAAARRMAFYVGPIRPHQNPNLIANHHLGYILQSLNRVPVYPVLHCFAPQNIEYVCVPRTCDLTSVFFFLPGPTPTGCARHRPWRDE